MNKMLNGTCDICGNSFGCDKESLKSSTWKINGLKIVLCCPCEDDLLKELLIKRGHKDLWKTIQEREA